MFCIWSTEHDDPSAGVIPGKVRHQLKGLLLASGMQKGTHDMSMSMGSGWHRTPHLQWQQNPGERFTPLDFELLNDCELPDTEWLSGSDSDPAGDFKDFWRIEHSGWFTRRWSINFVTVGSSSGHRHDKKETWRPLGTTGFLSTNSFCKFFIL